MVGLPDNAEMLRAVAELTSVGFEGGVSASTKSWFYGQLEAQVLYIYS